MYIFIDHKRSEETAYTHTHIAFHRQIVQQQSFKFLPWRGQAKMSNEALKGNKV